jgi:voltage-gated potassium channel
MSGESDDPTTHSQTSTVVRVVRSSVTILAMLGLYAVFPVPGQHTGVAWALLVALAGFGALAWATLTLTRQARQGPDRQAVRLEALIALVYAFLVFCSLVYLGLASRDGEFVGLHNRVDALYFTMSTVATVGFGDVHAEGSAARAVVTGQIFFDLVFLALIARIIVPSLTWRGRNLAIHKEPDQLRDSASDRSETG